MPDSLLVQFEQGFQLSKATNQTFYEKINAVITSQRIGKIRFINCTNLDDMTYSRIMNHIEYRPTIRTIVAIGMGLKLGFQLTNELLCSAGLTFAPTDRVHQAYAFLLENCKGMDIVECNTLLDKLSISEAYHLGSKARK